MSAGSGEGLGTLGPSEERKEEVEKRTGRKRAGRRQALRRGRRERAGLRKDISMLVVAAKAAKGFIYANRKKNACASIT